MRGGRGTTLVEVVIALGVLTFVLVTFLGIVFTANRLSTSSREGAVASYDLQSAVEDTFAIPYDDFKTRYPNNYVFPATVYNHLKNEALRLTRLAEDPGGNWVEYRIEITYANHLKGTSRESIVTRRSR